MLQMKNPAAPAKTLPNSKSQPWLPAIMIVAKADSHFVTAVPRAAQQPFVSAVYDTVYRSRLPFEELKSRNFAQVYSVYVQLPSKVCLQ